MSVAGTTGYSWEQNIMHFSIYIYASALSGEGFQVVCLSKIIISVLMEIDW